MIEIIQTLLELIKQLFCNHEYESNGIDEGCFHEHSSWCKKCGKPY